MPRPTLDNRHVRKLGKIGNTKSPSYHLTLPVELVRQLGWEQGQKLAVKKSRSRIVIENITLNHT